MLATGTALLREALETRRAIGAFTTYNLEFTEAIIGAAVRLGRPVIVQVGAGAFDYADREALAAMTLAMAAKSRVAVGIHLDHSHDLDEIGCCIALGYSSVMIDGSALPFEENIDITRAAVALAQDCGLWVEGELGAIGGNENVSVGADPEAAMTDPAMVRAFIDETGVDALAVAVGNVHGISTAVEIDLARLNAIRIQSTVPLVLHGASGLPDALIHAAIGLGVAKINVNTELRRAFLDGVRQGLNRNGGDSIDEVMRPARDAMEKVVERKLELLWRA
jgi:ketose-bisphosphate aldolase